MGGGASSTSSEGGRARTRWFDFSMHIPNLNHGFGFNVREIEILIMMDQFGVRWLHYFLNFSLI